MFGFIKTKWSGMEHDGIHSITFYPFFIFSFLPWWNMIELYSISSQYGSSLVCIFFWIYFSSFSSWVVLIDDSPWFILLFVPCVHMCGSQLFFVSVVHAWFTMIFTKNLHEHGYFDSGPFLQIRRLGSVIEKRPVIK